MVGNLRKLLLAGVLGVAGWAASASGAKACDVELCYYHRVTYYVTQEVPVQVCVTRYDYCGRPYQTYQTVYRTVEVPVTRWVP